MKFFVCMCALLTVSNAEFFGPGSVINMKIINEGHDTGNVPYIIKVVHQNPSSRYAGGGTTAAAQVIKVIHQESAPFAGNGARRSYDGYEPAIPSQVIRVIHQESEVPHPSTFDHFYSSTPQVIKVIQQRSAYSDGGYNNDSVFGSAPLSALAKIIKELFFPPKRSYDCFKKVRFHTPVLPPKPAKVIRIIHEHTQAQHSAAASASPVAPANNYMAPVQVSIPASEYGAPGFQQTTPAAPVAIRNNYLPPIQVSTPASEYGAPGFQQTTPAAPVNNYMSQVQVSTSASEHGAPGFQQTTPASEYIPPLPQAASFTAPEPLPSADYVPAESYGPPY